MSALDRLQQLKHFHACGQDKFEACCPGHDDRKESLSIKIENDGKVLLHCHAGCKLEEVLDPLGLKAKDLFPDNDGNGHHAQRRIVATYDYTDADGNLSYQTVRYEHKDFRARRPDGNGGWIWKVEGLKRLPYHLPELLQAEYVFIVEGEKDVDNLRKIGLTATCNPFGACSWTAGLSQYFRTDQHVTIIPDNDKPGRDHRDQVGQSLSGKVASLKVLELAGLPEHGDVSDWLNGRDPESAAEELSRLADAAPDWKPKEPEPEPSIIHWAHEALEPQPAKDWIVRDLIGSGDVAALIGDAGSKKTWTSLDLAVCVALGKEWLGRRVSRSHVLIVDEESGERRLKMRLGDCMRAHHAGADLPIAFTTMAGITLTSQEGADCLSQIIRETEARFILMDALQDFSLGLDENSGKDLAPVIHRLKVLAEKLGCAIWLIHHLNKQGAYRGHSSIKGLIDVMLKCESDPDSNLIQFTAEKSRDSLITPFATTAHFDLGRFWLTDAEPKAPTETMGRPERYVRDFMLKQPDKTARMTDIMGHADICSEDSARHAVYGLAERGRMKRIDAGGRGVPAVYRWVGI